MLQNPTPPSLLWFYSHAVDVVWLGDGEAIDSLTFLTSLTSLIVGAAPLRRLHALKH